jgi:inhibitor of KinA sporulation pathway (predicted exonuclease)
MSYFIIFDLEYTTWDNVKETMWTGEGQYREIVQIGALKVDRNTFEVLGELNVLVKPKINPQLSEAFQSLTNIQQESVDKEGISFEQAYERFNEFCGHALVFSYGSDMFVLGENVALNHCHPLGAFKKDGMGFVNIGPYFQRTQPDVPQPNSGRLWQHFNLPKPHEAEEHDALFDCYSILATMKYLSQQGHFLPL